MSAWQFDKPAALNINKARLSHLASLGMMLSHKSVLEVGAGVGRLTEFFEVRRCKIYSTDGRDANVKENRARHSRRKVSVADLMKPGSHDHFGQMDIVFCYGTLYHTADPALVIEDLARACKQVFLLETYVWHEDDGEIHPVGESLAHDQSLDGHGCRPARNWIMDELGKHYKHTYVALVQPNYPDYTLSWPASPGSNRAVFVASRVDLKLPSLATELPMKQRRLE